MITVENIDVWGFEHAIRGMRNPMNSWDRSDSVFEETSEVGSVKLEIPEIGPNDLDLMRRLYKAGHPHRKYLRQIMISTDITAPLYWWKEFDTYKVGTTANSCSTMHKIAAKEFTIDDFSWDQLLNTGCDLFVYESDRGLFSTLVQPLQLFAQFIIPSLNVCREKYLETKDKKFWWQLIQLLPASYNQKRTVTINYENVMNMLDYRDPHKLDEWNVFCDILKTLPYVKEIRENEKSS